MFSSKLGERRVCGGGTRTAHRNKHRERENGRGAAEREGKC